MKILVINTVDTARNGITNVIFNYVEAMVGQGVIFDLVSKNKPDTNYFEKIEMVGGSIYVLPRSIKKIINYIVLIKKIIQKKKYDVVHIHGNSGTCIIEAIAAKMARTSKIIVHAHSSSCKFKLAHTLLKPFLNMIIDGRLACSENSGAFLFGNNPFKILNNAFDVEKYRFHEELANKIRKSHNIPNDITVVGHVGTFSYPKNHELIVKLFEKYHSINNDSALLLIGEGETQEEMRALVKTMNIEKNVYFIGGVDNVNEYLSAIDCFLFPSKFEGLGMVLMEAQASGLSCLASTSVPDITNVTGSVVYLDLNEALSTWVETLISCIEVGESRDTKSDVAIRLLSEHGYNIKQEAVNLKSYYLSIRE